MCRSVTAWNQYSGSHGRCATRRSNDRLYSSVRARDQRAMAFARQERLVLALANRGYAVLSSSAGEAKSTTSSIAYRGRL